MADASVAHLITKAATVLGAEALRYTSSLVFEEALQYRQVHRKLYGVVTEFEVMLAFLRQLDVQVEEGVGKKWLEKVREAALEMEDIIDDYTYLVGSHEGRQTRDLLRKAIGRTPKPGSLPDIAQRLEDINSKLHHLSSMKERYSIKIVQGATPSHDTERWKHAVEVCSHLPEEDGFVGMEDSKAALLGWLMAEQGSQRKWISVWGMGGLGKTTLVAKVIKSQEVKEHFHIHAWVTVSEMYTGVDGVLRKILREYFGKKETMPDVDNMSHCNLVETLHKHLQGKRYLLVLDDVWSTSVWADVNDALTVGNGDCQSRIILTTRKRDVASVGDHVMELQPLDEKDAWVLFCRKAFCNERDYTTCPPHLEPLAKAILNKCDGLPLAIVALGSLLSLKDKGELEWRKVYDGLNWQLNNNPHLLHLRNILFWSFRELPDYLKHSFLYCCIFPEDYPIARKRLIRLWVAEGLVQGRGRLTVEEVAEENLNELLYRGMLQVAERNDFGKVRSCRMHDMMRELALQISEVEKFCSVHDRPEEILHGGARRLSLHREPQGIDEGGEWIGRLRSFLSFDGSSNVFFSMPSLFCTMCSYFKLLQVLDLQGAPIVSVSKGVYHLFNLRYLSLRETGVTKISKSLEKLCNLETLDLKNTRVKELPRGITKLKKLRHLIVGRYALPSMDTYVFFSGTEAPKELSNLKDLQTLHMVEASDDLVRCVGNLVNLRSLRIMKVRAAHCAELCASVSNMARLQTLGITASEDNGEMLQLDTMSSPPPYLQTLHLLGRLKNGKLPQWLCRLRNLTYLVLCWSGLREDPIPFLNKCLPSLVSLELSKVFEGQTLYFPRGFFPKLKALSLAYLPAQWIWIENGSMTGLESLCLCGCQNLAFVPRGIEHLPVLRTLNFVESREMVKNLLADTNTHEKVKLISSVQHAYLEDGQWLVEDIKISSSLPSRRTGVEGDREEQGRKMIEGRDSDLLAGRERGRKNYNIPHPQKALQRSTSI